MPKFLKLKGLNQIKRAPVALAVYLFAGLILFHKVFTTYFLSDDLVIFNLISINPVGYVQGGFFRPLCDLSNYLIWSVFGYDPLPYKALNLLIHIFNAWMVMLISRLLFRVSAVKVKHSFGEWLPFLAGWFFLIWPIRSESVFWLAGKASSLSFSFFALSFFCYLLLRIEGRKGMLLLSLASFLAGLLSYESLFAFPLIILVFEIYFQRERPLPEGKGHLLPVLFFLIFLLAFGLYYYFRVQMTGQLLGGYGDHFHTRINWNILRNLVVFPLKSILGAGLYSKTIFLSLSAMLLTGLSILLFIFKRKNNQIPAFWYFLLLANFLSYLPVINLSMSVSDTQFDRYLYLPSFFMILLIVSAFATLIKSEKTFLRMMIILSFYGIACSTNQSVVWEKASHLVKQTLETIKGLDNKSGDLFILNLPDHYRGAYVWRNGIHEGINKLCSDCKFESIHMLGVHPVWSLKSEVIVERKGSTIHLQIMDPRAVFEYEERSSSLHELNNPGDRGYTILFKNLESTDVILYYSSGQVRIF